MQLKPLKPTTFKTNQNTFHEYIPHLHCTSKHRRSNPSTLQVSGSFTIHINEIRLNHEHSDHKLERNKNYCPQANLLHLRPLNKYSQTGISISTVNQIFLLTAPLIYCNVVNFKAVSFKMYWYKGLGEGLVMALL